MKMPLEYVLSNAGYPMLVVDRYAYHKHSTSPKTNRTIWRCSRRRVKDIRCTSACNTFEDKVSKPSPHDPNCYELTKSELMLFNSRKEKMSMKVEAGLFESDIANKSLVNDQDCTMSKLVDDKNKGAQQNEQTGTISRLFDYTANTNNDESGLEAEYEHVNEHNSSNNDAVAEYDETDQDNPYNYTENCGNDYQGNDNDAIDQTGEFTNNQNDGYSDQNDAELDQNGGNLNDDYPPENYNEESDLIRQNEADFNGDYMNGNSTTDEMGHGTLDGNRTSDYTMNESKFDPYTGNLQFVTSKVGHPMLVVDGYTFHKHSTNPKTGRVNWRCARRRVKDIRCSSSCYTQDGIASVPKPHDPNCFPVRNAGSATQAKSINLKREIKINASQTSTPRFINTKAESYNSIKNRKQMNKNASDYRADIADDTYENNIDSFGPASNLNGDQFADEYGQFSNMDNNHGNHDEYASEYNGSEEYIPYNPNEHAVGNEDDDEFFIEPLGPDEYNIDDYSQTPESFAQLINDLNKMKQREKIYANKINTVNSELKRSKKQAAMQLQSFKWRSRMMEIDMSSLKASFNQKSMQNSHLRKLVADMMSKLKTTPHENLL